MKKCLQGVLLVLLILTSCLVRADCSQKADMIVFSYDRPTELYRLLESVNTYMSHLGEIIVIFRTSNEQFANAYKDVADTFSNVGFMQQGEQPENDFKSLVHKAVFDSSQGYIIFSVDDIVVKDFVNISECIDALERYNALGFYLRLGKNITRCYSMRAPQPVPDITYIDTYTDEPILLWKFSQGRYDWNYAYTVDMTVYRKNDIEYDLCNLPYTNPNKLESTWARQPKRYPYGVCYEQSKVVNIPLNRVQTVFKGNRCMNFLSPKDVLTYFQAGKKFDIRPFFKINNTSPHAEYTPVFIPR